MNASLGLAGARQRLLENLSSVRGSRFSNDRLSMGLLVVAAVASLLGIVVLAASLRPTGPFGPAGYSNLTAGYALGPWYFPYYVAGFAVVTTFVNAALAYRSYARSRLASFLLLLGSIIVAVFCLVVAASLGVAR